MSIASDYADFEDKVRYYNPEDGALLAEVTSDGMFLYKLNPVLGNELSPKEVLALAHWIIQTFGEGNE